MNTSRQHAFETDTKELTKREIEWYNEQLNNKEIDSQVFQEMWSMLIIRALGRLSQEDCYNFKVSLVYAVSDQRQLYCKTLLTTKARQRESHM